MIDERLFVTQDLGDNGPVSPIDINHNLIDVLVSPSKPGTAATIKTRALVVPWTVISNVRTVRSGGKDLALPREERGYGWVEAEPQLI